MTSTLSTDEKERYSRQLMLPQMGAKGQALLKRATVFISGLGGLGSAASYYLAAAGIGHMRLVDRDRVDLSNLNRQILHWTDDLGQVKANSAAEKLARLNPGCHVEDFHEKVTDDSVDRLMGDACIILDGTDNLLTRKVLNRASLRRRIPFVFAGVEGFTGMTSTFVPGRTPCLECLFPCSVSRERPPGVLGPLPGILGSIQALEAIKVILGMEGVLAGRLLHFNGLDMTVKVVSVGRNPDCPVCGPGRPAHILKMDKSNG